MRERYVVKIVLKGGLMLGSLLSFWVSAQQSPPTWQDDIRRRAEAQDWNGALEIVNQEIARSPQDMDVRAWRARVLLWSGQLEQARLEYQTILATAQKDPDDWMGLAAVYSREGKLQLAVEALDRAVALDPQRVDLRLARAKALEAFGAKQEAKLEFTRALDLDPNSAEGRQGLLSIRSEAVHELHFGMNRNRFNFADAEQEEGIVLTSHWTPRWTTSLAVAAYQWGPAEAQKVIASVTSKTLLGDLTVGGAAAPNSSIVAKAEGFFDCDKGFRLASRGFVRGVEIVYGQHWYWYTEARVLTINGTTTLYFPRDWTWSLRATGAQSNFFGSGSAWRPSGMARLAFPIAGHEQHVLGGNVFVAIGTESFAVASEIGDFSSQTYGAGLRLQLSPRQDISGYGAYQLRTQNRTESSFGFTYGIRF